MSIWALLCSMYASRGSVCASKGALAAIHRKLAWLDIEDKWVCSVRVSE